MDKFNQLAAAAKAKAEQGRQSFNARTASDTASPATASAPTSSGRAIPPLPGSSSSSIRTPATAPVPSSSTANGARSTFVNISHDDKQAFFFLLDEYFQSRPQYRHLLDRNNSTPVSAAAAAALPIASPPTPATTATPARVTPPAPPARKTKPVTSGIGMARATYDYTGTEADDLSFKAGDRITLVERISDDWWKGELRGETGIFPANYVQVEQ